MSFIQCSCYEDDHPFSLNQTAFSSGTIQEQDTRSQGIEVNEKELRSSKSFPNFKSAHEVAVHTADMSTRPVFVQELFFQKKIGRRLETTDKSVQIEGKHLRRKKSLSVLFACMLHQY
nr:unnamed protein product [Callosobruchus chinensis]